MNERSDRADITAKAPTASRNVPIDTPTVRAVRIIEEEIGGILEPGGCSELLIAKLARRLVRALVGGLAS